GGEHPALLEGAVVVDLVEHLSVGVIEPARKRRDDVRVGQGAAGNPVFGKHAAPGVAEAAGLDLLAERRGADAAHAVAGARIDRPCDVLALVEPDEQPLHRIAGFPERPPALLLARPGYVARSLAVAGLATDADLGPRGREAVRRRVVVLAHAGRVAL